MNKQKEALRLALEALEVATTPLARDRQEVLRAITALREALADSALDRMAENARDLGLDYEPPCKTRSQCTNKCQQCEQPAHWSIPQTAEQISDFIGSDYVWREHKVSDISPHEDDQYCVTAHDLLSAFARLADHIPDAGKIAEQPAPFDPSAGTQVSKVWWDGDKLMAQPIPLEQFYKEPEQPAQDQGQSCYCQNCEALSKELAALKAQQQQEPVAYMNQNGVIHPADYEWEGTGNILTPLYTKDQL